MVLLSVPLGAVLTGLHAWVAGRVATGAFTGALLTAAVVGGVFLLLLLLLGYLFQVREMARIWQRLPGWPRRR
jgi:TM2 domain-containing membrane protein YozV